MAVRMDAVANHPRIEILTGSRVLSMSNGDGRFQVTVEKSPLGVNENCDRCGHCIEVCPIKAYDSHEGGLSLRTAIDVSNPMALPLLYHIRKETPICQITCPVHLDIRGYVGLIAEGRYDEALALVRERNPLPGICGRVCNHPCEDACNRGQQDEPVAIDALKRFIADYELKLKGEGRLKPPRIPEIVHKEKVAIVGAGPAGLTVAHDLAWMGYASTIYEAAPVPGGMLWLCIPEYRLPRDIIEVEVDWIRQLGVEIKLNTPLNRDLTFDDLLAQGYSAVFLGVGAHKGRTLGVPGEEDFEGFLDCIVFLRRVNLGDTTKPGNNVVVIGGGNSAIDSARTALRLGCDEVTILYRRSRREMPANPWEVEAAMEEGVKIHFLAAPTQILGKDGRVTGMVCVRSELGRPDASGRRRPVPISGSEFEVEADLIIPAISQNPDISFLHEGHGLEISRWDSFVVDGETGQTNRPEVFAGGDDVTGPATVIEAIAAGHRAAEGIRRYLEV
jgi:NADPH-dependent glutamate synthase beta subunit-like oxidoreductase/NAD-dependent dihydropyrimidine dehydrogenase PreA subunit